MLNLYKCCLYVQAWKKSEMVRATRKCEVSHVSAMQTHNARNRILFCEEVRKSCLMQIKHVCVYCWNKFLTYIAVLSFWVVRLSSYVQMTLIDLIPNLTQQWHNLNPCRHLLLIMTSSSRYYFAVFLHTCSHR